MPITEMDVRRARRILEQKCRQHNEREYGGCLTPIEIIAICKVHHSTGVGELEKAIEHRRQGLSHPRWFYFMLREPPTNLYTNVTRRRT